MATDWARLRRRTILRPSTASGAALGNGLLQLIEVVARKKTGFQLSDAMFRKIEKGSNVTTLFVLQLFYAKRGNAEYYCHRRSLRIGSWIRYTVQSLVLHLRDMRRN